ncbi:MAG: hypothetical protein ACTSVG_03565 [Alphaproteobacteria bacterium]
MMPNLRGLFLLLLLASAVLASRIRDDLQRPPEPLVTSGPDAAASGQAIGTPEMPKYDPPPIELFQAALDRPLFSVDRRPPVGEPTEAGVVEDRALSATLQGILFATSGSVALLTAVGESSPVRVSEGEVFLGWRLLEIHPDNVVFGRDGETVTLELIYKAQPAPTAPPAAQRQ